MSPAVANIMDQAYRPYIARMDKPPSPMRNDYAVRVSEGVVWVLEEDAAITGIIVLPPTTSHLLLDNIAVSPARQGSGLGRRLPLQGRRVLPLLHRLVFSPTSGQHP